MEIEEYKALFKEYPSPKAKKFWVEDFNSMIVHTRGGHSAKLIGTRRPNEEQTTMDYRLANDRAITRDSFMSAITNLQRIISHSQVEIRYPDSIREYLENPNFQDSDFLSFFQRKIVKPMIEAANGLLVWWPEPDSDLTQTLEVKPIIVYPENIMHYDTEVLCFLSSEKSDVEINKKIQKQGNVYYIILRDSLWKRIQVGRKTENKYEFVEHSANPNFEIYALPLGGDEVSETVGKREEREEIIYLTSYLSSAVPFADECKVQFSDHQGVMVNCSSPLREVEQMNCTAEGCRHGWINNENLGQVEKIMCRTCKGSGKMPLNSSPYGVLVRPERKKSADTYDNSDIPVMRFIHPDTAILEFGNKSWRELLADTQDALKLLFTDEAQSGIAKNIDREDKLAWLDKVAVNIYKYLIVQSIQIIHKFQYPNDPYPFVQVNLPSTFVIKSEKEYTEELNNLRTQNVPEFIILETLREYTSKKFGGDPIRMKVFDTLAYIDPLFVKSNVDKINMFNSGFINEAKMQFSNFAPGVLANFVRQFDINELSVEEIAEQIRPLIEAQIQIFEEIRPLAD